MSIWGPNPFENDDATDWIADLRDEPSLDVIKQAIEEIAEPAHIGYIEVTDGAEAVAAAEVLAELLGSPGDNPVLNEETQQFAEILRGAIEREDRRNIEKLAQQAIDSIEIVLNDTEDSELRQMWEEQPEEMPAWITVMTALQRRLREIAVPQNSLPSVRNGTDTE